MKIAAKSGKRSPLLREIIETLLLTTIMFFCVNLAVQNYDVDGPSMEPNLHNQERIMVDKVSYFFQAPTRGDVVVFIAPPHPTFNYVKRVIGIPGDVVTVKGTTVILNGVTLKETYISPRYQGNPYAAVENFVVPADSYFVMGDDRANSSDSREWGVVPRKNMIGRATLVYWPLYQGNAGLVHNFSSVFEEAARKNASASKASAFIFSDQSACAAPRFSLVCSMYQL